MPLPSSLTQLIWTGYQSFPCFLEQKQTLYQTQFKKHFLGAGKDPDEGQDSVGNEVKILWERVFQQR